MTIATSSTSNNNNTKNQNNNHINTNKVIFVTVGTTLFTSLIDNILHPNTIQSIKQYGYTHLIIQYGKGMKPSIPSRNETNTTTQQSELQYEFYDYKPSLYDDMVKADLIICHAGAGTLTEAIRISQQQQQQQSPFKSMKKIVTVINNLLMDNHQKELAYALQRRQLVYVLDDPILLSSSSSSSSSVSTTTTTTTSSNIDTTPPTTTNPTIWEQIESFQPSTQTSLHGNPYDIPRILHQFFHGTNHISNRIDVNKEE